MMMHWPDSSTVPAEEPDSPLSGRSEESVDENDSPRVKNLTLIRVVSSNLSFGCMYGRVCGTEAPVTLSLFTHRRQRMLGCGHVRRRCWRCDH
jgi:hypothetical protein